MKRTDDAACERLLTWAEDRREVKNLMGKYAQCILLCLWDELDMLWSTKEDICLGLNDGWFVGRAEVRRYYDRKRENTAKKAELMQTLFPAKLGAKSLDELHGVGMLEEKAVSTPYMEIAADGQTAKGIWYSRGSLTDITAKGPLARWTWGAFAVDFVREEDGWRIWHLQYREYVNEAVGVDWANPTDRYPDLPEFAPVAALVDAEPTVSMQLCARYTARQPFQRLPDLPQPYDTFAETFSYGYEVTGSDR